MTNYAKEVADVSARVMLWNISQDDYNEEDVVKNLRYILNLYYLNEMFDRFDNASIFLTENGVPNRG
jgi:hypothetical protein